MIVYVVTYQTYLYGDEYDEIKYVMEGFDVKGVFSTKKKAEEFMKEYIRRDADDFYGDDLEESDQDFESKKNL